MDDAWKTLASDLRTIALVNPKLALMLARGQPMADRSYAIRLLWDIPAAEKTQQSSLAERLYQDAWIQDFVYTIRMQDFMPGSALKGVLEIGFNENPYIDLDMRVEGPDRYEITNGLVPLENICSTRKCQRKLMMQAMVISRDQNLFVRAINKRTFAPGETPYELVLNLNVKELSGCNLRTIGYDEAVCALRKMGLYPSE